MKKFHSYIIVCAVVGALLVLTALVLPNIMADTAPHGSDGTTLQNPGNQRSQPETIVQDTWPEGIPFIEVHAEGGRSIRFSPDDHRYPAIETECREQIQSISAQFKSIISPAELGAMKHNGTYVAITFSRPTTFETSYIVDGSPREITINEAILFLNLEDYPETMIITLAQDGAGVWDSARDRGELWDLVAPILLQLQSEDG